MFDIGIIGGMGPQACSTIFDFIVKNTEATKDQDHPSIIILNDTKIPDRSDYILKKSSNSPFLKIKKDLDDLALLNVRVVGIACNTSHYFIKELLENNKTQLLNMPKLTLDYCKKNKIDKILVLSTLGTINAKIYEDDFYSENNVIYPTRESAISLHRIIYDIKNSSSLDSKCIESRIKSIIQELTASEPANNKHVAIILGCTELSIFSNQLREITNISIIDPLEILAFCLIKKSGYNFKRNNNYNFDIIERL